MQARLGVLLLVAGSDLIGRRKVGKSKRTKYCAADKPYFFWLPVLLNISLHIIIIVKILTLKVFPFTFFLTGSLGGGFYPFNSIFLFIFYFIFFHNNKFSAKQLGELHCNPPRKKHFKLLCNLGTAKKLIVVFFVMFYNSLAVIVTTVGANLV